MEKKENIAKPVQQGQKNNPVNDVFKRFLRKLPENRDFMFKFLDMFPIPIEIFEPDGNEVFVNQALVKLNNLPDASYITGKYNVLNDPLINDQMGMRDSIRKAFDGEPVVACDVVAPIRDVIKRGLVNEKSYEKSFMDFYLYPIMKGRKLIFVVFICIVKKLYYGRPDLAKANEYMDNHWQGSFIPEEVAKSVNMSVAQLYKLFKQHNGITPGDYFRTCKVEHLKENLIDRNLSIKEAFAACGENSRGSYAKIFKRVTGLSPAKYRNMLK